jgi:thiol:disulfide interchange protein
MKIVRKWWGALALCLSVVAPLSAKEKPKAPPAEASGYQAVTSFDAARNPTQDLKEAIAEATRTKKRILLEVGGDWSVYCNLMDVAFDSHPRLRKVRDTHYITVKIHYSKDNPNEAFLAHYPSIPNYPHFFVLDSNGTLLHSQPTRKFEQGKKYNAGKIEAFLKKWAQPPQPWLHSVG